MTSTLKEEVAKLSEEEVRQHYATLLWDWADDDTKGRELALRVLSDFEVNGDSYGVPSLVDIIETLVKKIEEGAKG